MIGFINTHPLVLKPVLSRRSRKQIILQRLVGWSSHVFSSFMLFYCFCSNSSQLFFLISWGEIKRGREQVLRIWGQSGRQRVKRITCKFCISSNVCEFVNLNLMSPPVVTHAILQALLRKVQDSAMMLKRDAEMKKRILEAKQKYERKRNWIWYKKFRIVFKFKCTALLYVLAPLFSEL